MRGKMFMIVILFALGIYPVMALDNLMALQGTALDSGQPANGNLTITIWNQSSGGSMIYDSGTDFDNKIIDGRFDIMIGQVTELTLEYGKYYYIDMSVNNQDLDFNGSERQIFQSSIGMINKNNIYSTGTWDESEIPSLTSAWTGTIDSSKITGSVSLNVNNSQYLGGLTKDDFLNNDTQLSNRINAVNTSISGKLDSTDQRFNETSLISNKLDLTDQRFNETSRLNAVNTTINIQSLGFNTTSQLNNLYYLVTNPSNYVSLGIATLTNFYNKTDSDNRYLQLTDQRFNETSRLNAVNTTINIQSLGFNTTSQL
ncbi:MAG: hypothetical protein ACP5NV_02785, partial [Candidatus Woesearchaeota archaeon]